MVEDTKTKLKVTILGTLAVLCIAKGAGIVAVALLLYKGATQAFKLIKDKPIWIPTVL